MDIEDLDRLREIAARPEEEDHAATYAPLSDARMRAAAQAVITHAERFDLDGEVTSPLGEAAGLPFHTYVTSLVVDLLHLADVMEPPRAEDGQHFGNGGARETLRFARDLISDCDTVTTLEGLPL